MALNLSDPVAIKFQSATLEKPSVGKAMSEGAKSLVSARRATFLAQGEDVVKKATKELADEGLLTPEDQQQFEFLDYSNPETIATAMSTLSGIRKIGRADKEIKTNVLDSVPQELDQDNAVEWVVDNAPKRLSPQAYTRFQQVYGGLASLIKQRKDEKKEKDDKVYPVFVGFVESIKEKLDDPTLTPDQKRQLLAKGVADHPELSGYKPFQDLRTTLNTSAAIKTASAGKRTKDTFDVEHTLSEDFRKSQNDFLIKQTASNTIASLSDGPAGDLALVYAYMKLLDPTSAVREAEYANAANAAGVPDRVKAMYNRALSGESLAPAQRSNFRAEADRLYASSLASYRATRAKAIKQAGEYTADYGVDPERAIPDMEQINDTFDVSKLSAEIAGSRARSGRKGF